MNSANTRIFWRDPVGLGPILKPGTKLRVELDQIVDGRRGPHFCGEAEVYEGNKLKLSLITISEAGRAAIAFLADDILDAQLWGSTPVVRLR